MVRKRHDLLFVRPKISVFLAQMYPPINAGYGTLGAQPDWWVYIRAALASIRYRLFRRTSTKKAEKSID